MSAVEPEQALVPINIMDYRDGEQSDDDVEIEIHLAMPNLGEWCEVKGSGLVFKPDTPFEAWASVTNTLVQVGTRIQWLIGDALRFGERKYGEMYSQILTGHAYQTLRDMKWVAEKVELSLRNDNLSWNHHRAVAPLPPQLQKQMLEKAEDENLSVQNLRAEVFEKQREITGEAPLWALVIDDPAWLQFAGSDGQEEWSVDVEKAGPVLLSVNGESVTFLDIDAAIRRLCALRDLAKKHFGQNWPRG